MARSSSRGRAGSTGEPVVPPDFLERMAALLGEEYVDFAATYSLPARSGLRVNTLKTSPERFAHLAPFGIEPLGWPPPAFLVDDEAQPGKHPYHAAGLYYLQDPAAMVPAALLAPQPGDRVLDLSAAPGGKATHLASLLAGTGLLVANEIHARRAQDLAENLERWGARNAVITNETPERLAEAFPGFFDRVLVDAPCSGEGMFRKSKAARAEWAPALVHGCALRQTTILNEAARMVRPGGMLAYVTCTFAPEEDEGSVASFLQQHPDFALYQPSFQAGFAPGRPDWLPAGQAYAELERTVRLWPHRFPGEGHFIALLQRTGTGERAVAPVVELDLSSPTPGQWELYRSFCEEHLAGLPVTAPLGLTGSYLYQVPQDLIGTPSARRRRAKSGLNLRYLHPGWLLGSFKKDRFEPSHAMALALTPDQVRLVVDLDPAGPEALAYLRGEPLRREGPDGWVLVAVDGFALGWAKRVQGILKSHYPRGLRRY